MSKLPCLRVEPRDRGRALPKRAAVDVRGDKRDQDLPHPVLGVPKKRKERERKKKRKENNHIGLQAPISLRRMRTPGRSCRKACGVA